MDVMSFGLLLHYCMTVVVTCAKPTRLNAIVASPTRGVHVHIQGQEASVGEQCRAQTKDIQGKLISHVSKECSSCSVIMVEHITMFVACRAYDVWILTAFKDYSPGKTSRYAVLSTQSYCVRATIWFA